MPTRSQLEIKIGILKAVAKEPMRFTKLHAQPQCYQIQYTRYKRYLAFLEKKGLVEVGRVGKNVVNITRKGREAINDFMKVLYVLESDIL